MAVYVDLPRYRLGRMKMCHLLADSADELHAMADRIGVERRHFQAQASTPHYDICKAKRRLALKAGAIDSRRREIVAVIRRLRRGKTA